MTTIPTIGFNVETVCLENISITVWDIGYRDKLVPLWKHYYEGAHGVVFVVDSNDAERFHEAREALGSILTDETMRNKPLLVMSNKVDLPEAKNVEEVRDGLGLMQEKVGERKWFIQETCALKGKGLLDGFAWLASNIP